MEDSVHFRKLSPLETGCHRSSKTRRGAEAEKAAVLGLAGGAEAEGRSEERPEGRPEGRPEMCVTCTDPFEVSTANHFCLSTENSISISPNFPLPAPQDWSCFSHEWLWAEASPGSLD